MPTRIQPSMDLQLNASGMGPAMMRLDHTLPTTEPEPIIVIAPEPVIIVPRPTRWQRLWAFLNKDVRDIWRDLVNAARTR